MRKIRTNQTLFDSFFAWKRDAKLVEKWAAAGARGVLINAGPPMACQLCEAYARKWGCHLRPKSTLHSECPETSAAVLFAADKGEH